MIFSILNTKGGCGKSTVAINLAAGLAHYGQEILIIDTDEAGTALAWSSRREEASQGPTVVSIPDANALKGQIGKLIQKYDHIVIDGAPKLERLLTASVAIADQVIIPVLPSPNDLWKLEPMVDLVQRAQETTEELTGRKVRICFLLNRVQARTRLSQEAEIVLSQFPFPVLRSKLAQRIDYCDSLSEGTAAISFTNKKARDEVNSLLSEVTEHLAA